MAAAYPLSSSSSIQSFPQKLFILMEIESEGVIQWASHGLCFRIIDHETFTNHTLPKYFKRKYCQ
jgi:hypothetical protein